MLEKIHPWREIHLMVIREAMKHFGVLKDEAQEEDDEFIEEISETEIKKNFIKDSNNNDKNNNQVNEEEEFIEVFESEEEIPKN